ncbi:hypothetical protein V5E97_28740 [Singulisphaera sp. Ch08]|uniref:Uncharacterized protein n=1 Tax=Singulisphaera sp. Ch08 TaxID=3120278 RepID=A0AAU7CAW9_9BACT
MGEQPNDQSEGVPLRLDPKADSAAPSLPAFLARPEGAPVYHGFPLLEQSRSDDGWCFGTISEPNCSEGRDWGDAFVVAPDGTRAGVVWQVGDPVLEVMIDPEVDRWGVYQVGVAHQVHDEQELVTQLQLWLPEFRRLHGNWRAERP